jgi:hypothetical protein
MDPQFGARCDGTGNDQPAIMYALDAAKASPLGRIVYIPGIARVTQGFSLDSSYAGIVLLGPGGNRGGFLKAFNGDLCQLSSVLNFEAHSIYVNGQYGTNTGKGFVFAGNCNYPVIRTQGITPRSTPSTSRDRASPTSRVSAWLVLIPSRPRAG